MLFTMRVEYPVCAEGLRVSTMVFSPSLLVCFTVHIKIQVRLSRVILYDYLST